MCCECFKIVCYLEYRVSVSPHTDPAETITAASDAWANPEQNSHLWSVSTVLGIVLHAAAYWLFHLLNNSSSVGGVAGKYTATRGSARQRKTTEEVHALNNTRRCAHLQEKRHGCVMKMPALCLEENRDRSGCFLHHNLKKKKGMNEVRNVAWPPSYRCATCRRWGTSESDSTGICCGISCECDSEDHSDHKPTLTWLFVWRNPKSKKEK